ncbi:MAG: response regulator transcription factor [Chloroflexi bacterium]|nr:response regulator transcription factor [Chloroflexota bacterium]
MQKIRVLVVDDHALVREGINALLGLHDDIEIVGEASGGREAVVKALELAPDIVVMDIAMPEMEGLEATRRIKKKNPKVKVLLLTQHDNREYILSGIRAGGDGYIPKKAMGEEFISAIRFMHSGGSYLYPTAASVVIKDYRELSQDDPYDRLTDRERDVLKLISEGYTSRQIAEKLFITQSTVVGHRMKLMAKLNLHNRTEVIRYAVKKGLISL